MKPKNSRYLLLTVLLIALSGECIGQTAFPPASDQDVLDAANVFMAKMIGFTGSIFGSVNEVQRKDHDRINVLQSMFADAFPCVVLGLKVVDRSVQFTTPTQTCTAQAAWSPQTGLQGTPRVAFAGTIIGTYDSTQKGAFTFTLPATAPLHGTFQVLTIDAGGVRQSPRQIEF